MVAQIYAKRKQMKNVMKYWWVGAIILATGFLVFLGHQRANEFERLQDYGKIAESYRTVPDYFVTKTPYGVIVISNQEHSRTVSLITSTSQKSLKINGRVYEIVRNGSYLNRPDLKWYNLSLPESVTNEIIEKQIVSVNGSEYAVLVCMPNQ